MAAPLIPAVELQKRLLQTWLGERELPHRVPGQDLKQRVQLTGHEEHNPGPDLLHDVDPRETQLGLGDRAGEAHHHLRVILF